MRRIALMNQKGGVGKTTTTVNLAAALSRENRKVCIVDMDPQAHSTTHLGVDHAVEQPSVYDLLTQSSPLADVRKQLSDTLWIVPSSIDLANAEAELIGLPGREMILRDLLNNDGSNYDYILFDCPPSLGVLSLNALTASDEVFVPLQPHYLALHGLSRLFETVQLVSRRLNPQLIISGVVLCLYETGTRLSAEVLNDLEGFLEQAKQHKMQTPWAQAEIFNTRIRRNIKLAECASFGQPIFDYDASCNGAKDYQVLAREVIAQEAAMEQRTRPRAAA